MSAKADELYRLLPAVYRLRDAEPLVMPATPAGLAGTPPPARQRPQGGSPPAPVGAGVVAMGHDRVTIDVGVPGRYLVKVTWSPYWRLDRGRGSVGPAPGGWTVLDAPTAGVYVMRLRPTVRAALDRVF